MRFTLCLVSLLCVLPRCATPGFASSREIVPAFDVFSSYIWRGLNLGDDLALQPSLTVSQARLSLVIWGNYETGESHDFTEVDFTLEYAFPARRVEAFAGFTYYTFPNLDGGDDSQEVYAGITSPGKLPIHLTAYCDYREGTGLYAELGTQIPVAAGDAQGTLSLALGYNNDQWRDGAGFSHVVLELASEFSLGRVDLSPVAGFSVAVDDDFGDELYFGVRSAFY